MIFLKVVNLGLVKDKVVDYFNGNETWSLGLGAYRGWVKREGVSPTINDTPIFSIRGVEYSGISE